MSKIPTPVSVTEQEQRTLASWIRGMRTEQRLVLRAKIILAAASGQGTNRIARELGVRPATVSKWRTRFASLGLEGLRDAPRSGATPVYDENTERRILAVLDEDPPPGYATWTGKLVAKRLGDVSPHQVWRVLRRHGIHLQRRRSWCISTDPQFAPKAADIVGLYLDPPTNAVVISVDEKPCVQALERAQGYLRLPNGHALTGFGHEYKRHGTTTLFAALEVATGQVKVGHYKRRRRREFLDFMNEVIADRPDQEIHVILDNLRTHKPKRDHWLARHKNVHFHFTPTHASWLNQVECWFSILTGATLRRGSFTSPKEVRTAIDQFVHSYNQEAAPFEWRKRTVHPVAPQKRYSNLGN
ncbi:MAG: IS630 family transposase [Deltaproteobacteria bacterium]|nr:IS630 family transposase [Deltaproteobacteria bacterium]